MEARADDARRRRVLVITIAFTALCIACSSLALVASLLARREEAAVADRLRSAVPAEATPALVTDPAPSGTPLETAPAAAETGCLD